MKPKQETVGKMSKPTFTNDKLKKKLKVALEKVKDKLHPNEFMSTLNSSANIGKPKSIPNQRFTSKTDKNKADNRAVPTKPHKNENPAVSPEQHADKYDWPKKKKSEKNMKKAKKVNLSCNPHGADKPNGEKSDVKRVNGTQDSTGDKKQKTSKKTKKSPVPDIGLPGWKTARTKSDNSTTTRKSKPSVEALTKKTNKYSFKESDIEDYQQIFNPSEENPNDEIVKTVKKKSKKKSTTSKAPTHLTVAHRETDVSFSDSGDEDYYRQFFGDSDDYSSDEDYSDEGEYYYNKDDFGSDDDSEEKDFDSQEEDYHNAGDSYDSEADDDSYSEEFWDSGTARNSYDRDSSDSDNDDIRIAAGTAVVHKIPDEQFEGLFQHDSKACIVEYGETIILGNLSPICVAARKARDMKLKEIEEQNKKLFEKRTREYWNSGNVEPDMTDLKAPMCAKVIVCQQGGMLLDITIDQHLSEPRLKRRRINLCTPSELFSDTILSTADMTCRDDSSESEYEGETVGKRADLEMTEPTNGTQEGDPDSLSGEADTTLNKPDISSNILESSMVNDADEEAENNNASLLGRKSLINQQKPKFFNSTNSRHVLVLLRNKLYFNGHVHVTLIAGEARIFGFDLIQNKQVDVHSPRGFSQIFIEPLTASEHAIVNTTSGTIAQKLKKFTADFLAQDIDYLLTNFNADTDALVLLERNRSNTAVHMTERYMKETFVPNINSFNNDSYYYSSEFILNCRLSFRPRSGLIINADWNSVPITATSKVLVAGGKSVGKSTFVRYFINSHLSKFGKFLLVDLDIGQPEVFLPQTISATIIADPILGPGFLHNIKPVKSILYGDVNVLPSPIKYLKCVMDLFGFCATNEGLSNIPWIINTMGYTRGLGSELICSILRVFNPTDVVQIQGYNHRDNFERALTSDAVNNCYFEVFKREMENIGRKCTFRTHHFQTVADKDNKKNPFAKDIRYAMILSKLGAILKSNFDWLSTVKPFSVSLNDLKVIVPENENIHPACYAELLNGSLVYLCHKSDEVGSGISCSGIGLVRAVDKITSKIFLVSSVTGRDLCEVNALAICAIPLPSAVLLNQHSLVRGSVPFVYNTDSFVGSKQVAQRVYKPQGHHNSFNKSFQ